MRLLDTSTLPVDELPWIRAHAISGGIVLLQHRLDLLQRRQQIGVPIAAQHNGGVALDYVEERQQLINAAANIRSHKFSVFIVGRTGGKLKIGDHV